MKRARLSDQCVAKTTILKAENVSECQTRLGQKTDILRDEKGQIVRSDQCGETTAILKCEKGPDCWEKTDILKDENGPYCHIRLVWKENGTVNLKDGLTFLNQLQT